LVLLGALEEHFAAVYRSCIGAILATRKARMAETAYGETIYIPAKSVVKFWIAKAAKDAIAPVRKGKYCR